MHKPKDLYNSVTTRKLYIIRVKKMFQRLREMVTGGPALPPEYNPNITTFLWNTQAPNSYKTGVVLQGLISGGSATMIDPKYTREDIQMYKKLGTIFEVTPSMVEDLVRVAATEPNPAVHDMAIDMVRSYHACGDFSQTDYVIQTIFQQKRSRELLESIDAKFDASKAPPRCQELDMWYNRADAVATLGTRTEDAPKAYAVALEISAMTHEHPSVVSKAQAAVRSLEPLLAK